MVLLHLGYIETGDPRPIAKQRSETLSSRKEFAGIVEQNSEIRRDGVELMLSLFTKLV
jgi:hypothetical protein